MSILRVYFFENGLNNAPTVRQTILNDDYGGEVQFTGVSLSRLQVLMHFHPTIAANLNQNSHNYLFSDDDVKALVNFLPNGLHRFYGIYDDSSHQITLVTTPNAQLLQRLFSSRRSLRKLKNGIGDYDAGGESQATQFVRKLHIRVTELIAESSDPLIQGLTSNQLLQVFQSNPISGNGSEVVTFDPLSVDPLTNTVTIQPCD